MSLNVKMHDRNPYKEKINFEYLSSKYDILKNVIQRTNKGKLLLDFKNSKCLQALSWCLLKEDFGLDVIIPINKLIPTIPLRLNYILWIEDIFKYQNLRGIDIGCGASCVYSLLGAKKNDWHFLSTESDIENYNIAVENVSKNNLTNWINVVKVNNETSLSKIIVDNSLAIDQLDKTKHNLFDFLMCNPPFFDSLCEEFKESYLRRKIYSTADVPERSFPDRGEIGFVEKVIIEASLILREKVRVYSTMLGKKGSLKALINILKKNMITNIGTTKFCQGNTIRWGLAWSFDTSFTLPTIKDINSTNLSFSFNIVKCNTTDLNTIICIINEILLELEATKVSEEYDGENIYVYELMFKKMTWSNQRKKRREMKRKFDLNNIKSDEKDDSKKSKNNIDNYNKVNEYLTDIHAHQQCEEGLPPLNKSDETETISDLELVKKGIFRSEIGKNTNADNSLHCDKDMILLKCRLKITETSDQLNLEFELIESINKDYLHCIFQLFRNRLTLKTI